ncbi:MAG: substrate-binding domain-containing protein [Acidobacteria bacterium]|nr:substrate-binding domain-containing protein [Acidobacteriota bacterium]
MNRHLLVLAVVGFVLAVKSVPVAIGTALQGGATNAVLRLATTTSTADSGLLSALLPDFERQCGCRVDVVAVGTGQALELGRRGDVDVLLVHAREAEDAFVAEGHATRRDDVMYNDFVIVGPGADPAGIGKTKLAVDAFKAIAGAKAPFASRGDKSGTQIKELALWKSAGLAPTREVAWYLSVGQGMGETLTFADERQAYTLSDRATWLAMRSKLTGLRLLFGGETLKANPDRDLHNDYGVIAISPAKHPSVQAALAGRFVEWVLSKPTQARIGAFGVDRVGQPLFYPNSEELKAATLLRVQVGPLSRTFTIDQLKALPKVTLPNHEITGVRRGKIGPTSWAGASLVDVLRSVDPTVADTKHGAEHIVLTSSDGYTVTLRWTELFGLVSKGERVYLAKGCNECHGANGEGTAPAGKRPAPALARRAFDAKMAAAAIRDPARHAGIGVFTTANLTDQDVAAMLGWLKNPATPLRQAGTDASPASRVVVLAYQRDGRPMTGRDGLIQLVVASDEFASRYSHWVTSITVRYR